MRFGEDGLTIGKPGNPLTFRVVNDRLAFYIQLCIIQFLKLGAYLPIEFRLLNDFTFPGAKCEPKLLTSVHNPDILQLLNLLHNSIIQQKSRLFLLDWPTLFC